MDKTKNSNVNSGNKKKIYWILAAVLLIVILVVVKKCNSGGAIAVNVQQPVRRDIVESIPANGKIQPVTEVKISPDVSGEIIELNVKEGDRVKKGDLIIKIKQDNYLSSVDQAQASLNATRAAYEQQKAQVAKSTQNYERNKKLYAMRTISTSDYEAATSEYKVALQQLNAAKYNIQSAEAQLKEARENLIKTTIYAPMDGIVSKLEVEKGERVVGTSQMAGTEMLRIANFDQMEVVVDVNENDIIRLQKGDTSEISVDAYPDRKFKGVVTEVANSSKNSGTATTTETATNFAVKVVILPESYQDLLAQNPTPFRPGMSASVQIQTSRKSKVLTLPLQAITTRKDIVGKSIAKDSTTDVIQRVFVYNKKTGTVSARVVKTGIQDLNSIEITDGISDTTQVVIGPFSAISKGLNNGTKVKVSKGEVMDSKPAAKSDGDVSVSVG
ncbi:MAG: efflux RND transporter periplasmic adaptor subunit [Bacteroidales bacterium]|jgi:HlyD family secretion protein|nr:efflux RND transporter periplasmic adaptor subunit [Bacteroidales bacterium]MCI1733846.1 efflux RND transporter periplasmic adaptor subunit [Bacteroidales bacterium]